MTPDVEAHNGLHSEYGARRGEHPGRSRNPVIKVHDIAWLEFEKPDLDHAEAFGKAFGFAVAVRTPDALHLRGADAGAPCVLIRRGRRSRFVGAAFTARDQSDVQRLADATGRRPRDLPARLGGLTVDLTDPSGLTVRVVADTHQLEPLPAQAPHTLNVAHELKRVNATQRPPRRPATVQRLGHLALQTTSYLRTLNWYLDTLGMIVSDFLFFPGQRDRGPAMSFIRCDRGMTPTDHHTLALALAPANRYLHSAYQVCDLDSLAAGGEYLASCGYHRSWGIGRHIQGSQIFDYWRDPDGFMVEHFSDGDMFDCSLEPGWAPLTASGLVQWGPAPTRDYLGTSRKSLPREALSAISALCADNEFDYRRLIGLIEAAKS
ncbi:VOC family protein [Mycobacterium lacus]|uniref:Putative 2,3-dihydroxybiphenyl-1,2-dioxygenase or glyoxalase/bleomycin resistance protein n=1 Tax=Mycobacterium lacus TaxID=169765 RepID=A0A1X1XWW1_9MYCO|nr:VOC family protein [Mycobacterium lacus]MCV7125101.1 VOC family protein [Mycobacterium lacus]ORW03289.1 2,3-dihydroxybiphenyl 1,2-dioxygenase [Mycobacterium lacus]BBX97673.1 putative 2,3-dihydroxybiphenyl-1,2-dioxygenase or glyoxalase/bleomycin resistance protein [Mycobacterium lacus]